MRVMTGMLCLVMLLGSCARPTPHSSVSGVPVPGAGNPAQQLGEAGHVFPDSRVGAVFRGALQDGANVHVCTGSVLHSRGGDLVLTAAHCLLGDAETTFVPGLVGEPATADAWTVSQVYFDRRWIVDRDPRADYAIARVSGTAGQTVENRVAAALSLGIAPAAGTRVSVTGYPAGVGGEPIGCQGSTGVTDSGFPSLSCAGLVGGTSGAPWVTGSTVVGVIGGLDGGGCTENISYSAPFDHHTAELLARAESGGPGDTAPDDFEDSC